MSLERFSYTDRAWPIVQIGLGDTRIPTGSARWDRARWDRPGSTWASSEPEWLDITCETFSATCEYGRRRTTDRFVPGAATIVVDNRTGWADPVHAGAPNIQTMRPGRPVRFGVVHRTLGTCWRFRGFIDVVTPRYEPADGDTVELSCVDALGEVGRAKWTPYPSPIGDGDDVNVRLSRILDLAKWSTTKRLLDPSGTTLVADALGGQAADLLGQAADSGGGSVFGDLDANIVYRNRDWQTYLPGTPPDGTIGNVDPFDVCPTGWVRPFDRADIATRAIVGRDLETAVTVDDLDAQLLYGIEPFERTDLLTRDDFRLVDLAERILVTRAAATAPRVRSVSLDARTADNVLDLMATVTPYKPSRYRCRLQYPRGEVFDADMIATGVAHVMTPTEWSLNLNLDLAEPYKAPPDARWDRARWDRAAWSYTP